MRRVRFFVAVALTAAVGVGSAALASESTPLRGELITASPTAQLIPGSYIVQLRTSDSSVVQGLATSLVSTFGGTLGFVYDTAIHGFSVQGLPASVARLLAASPLVSSVEQDQRVYATTTTQTNAPNGVDRLDQTSTGLNGRYTYGATGSGVHVYGIDTGIRTSHQDFGGRASSGYTAINDGRGANDCDSIDKGHGTNTASLAVGTTYGVAKRASIVAVRVLDCNGNGSSAQVIAGINWVAKNAVKPAVATLSLGACGKSPSEDDALEAMIAKNITAVVAAGNGSKCGTGGLNGARGIDACNTSPSDVGDAIVVGALDSSDTRPTWSNYGSCVSLSAPGVDIVGAGNTSNNATTTLSGTSQATPLVAGAAAQYLSLHPSYSTDLVKRDLMAGAATGVKNGAGSPNKIVNTLFMNNTNNGSTSNPKPTPAPSSTDCGPCYPKPILKVATGGGKANLGVTVRPELVGKTIYYFVRSGQTGQVRSLGTATVAANSGMGYALRQLGNLKVGQAMRIYAKINDAPTISDPRSNDVDFHVA